MILFYPFDTHKCFFPGTGLLSWAAGVMCAFAVHQSHWVMLAEAHTCRAAGRFSNAVSVHNTECHVVCKVSANTASAISCLSLTEHPYIYIYVYIHVDIHVDIDIHIHIHMCIYM